MGRLDNYEDPERYRKAGVHPLVVNLDVEEKNKSTPVPLLQDNTHLEPGLLLLLLRGRGRCRERAQVAVAALSGAVHCAPHCPLSESLSRCWEKKEKKEREK